MFMNTLVAGWRHFLHISLVSIVIAQPGFSERHDLQLVVLNVVFNSITFVPHRVSIQNSCFNSYRRSAVEVKARCNRLSTLACNSNSFWLINSLGRRSPSPTGRWTAAHAKWHQASPNTVRQRCDQSSVTEQFWSWWHVNLLNAARQYWKQAGDNAHLNGGWDIYTVHECHTGKTRLPNPDSRFRWKGRSEWKITDVCYVYC